MSTLIVISADTFYCFHVFWLKHKATNCFVSCYVPDHPENHDDDTLEGERSATVNEMKKRSKDTTFIRQKMDLTFSLRRKEIVDQQPLVSEIQERWPALFSEEQLIKSVISFHISPVSTEFLVH